jgi:hypothetical protein
MKKLMLLVGLLMIAGIPLMAAEVTTTGIIDANYFNESPTDDNDDEPAEGYFGEVCASVKLTAALDDGLKGVVKIAMAEGKSQGQNSSSALWLEEMYVNKADAFDQAGLSFQFGKFEVPHNMDLDQGITHSLSWLYEMDECWGLTVGYAVEGVGTFKLTTFEGYPGLDTTGPDDEDTGLFNSMALQWDTGEDAFEVDGLRLVVAYAAVARDEDLDDASNISIGGTYALKDMGLKFGLEIDMSTAFHNFSDLVIGMEPGLAATVTDDYYLTEGCMLIALNVDYTIPDQPFKVGLTYEMLTINEDTTDEFEAYAIANFGAPAGAELESNTTTRLALRGEYNVVEDGSTKIRFEYSSISIDLDGLDEELGGSIIALGVLGKF